MTVRHPDGRVEVRSPDSFGSQIPAPSRRPPRGSSRALLTYAEYLRAGGDPNSNRGLHLRATAARTCTTITLKACEEAMR